MSINWAQLSEWLPVLTKEVDINSFDVAKPWEVHLSCIVQSDQSQDQYQGAGNLKIEQ